MVRLIQLLKVLRQQAGGMTALEFSLLAGALALALIGAVHTLGTAVTAVSTDISGAIW